MRITRSNCFRTKITALKPVVKHNSGRIFGTLSLCEKGRCALAKPWAMRYAFEIAPER